MTRITVKFTASEIELLGNLASDQLFRREFIDSRQPGYKANVPELNLGKQLVVRLRSARDRGARNGAALTLASKSEGEQ